MNNNIDWIEHLKTELNLVEQRKSPPDIPNFQNEVEEYAKNLNGDRTHCLEEVQHFASTRITTALIEWKSGLSNLCTGLHKQINNQRAYLQKEGESFKVKRELADNKVKEMDIEIQIIEEDLHRLQQQKANIEPTTKFALFSYVLFIIASILVGILTFWYFVNIQGQMYYVMTGREVEKFKTWTFITQENGWIYGLGVIGILMAGKIISIIYEKIGFAKWFFLIIAFMAVIVTVSSTLTASLLSSYMNELALNFKEIEQKSFTSEIANILGESEQLDCSKEENSERDYCKLVLNQQNIKDNIKLWDAPSKILVFFADILLGAVAWILAVDYHSKSGSQPQKLKNQLSDLEQRKTQYDAIKQEYNRKVQENSYDLEQLQRNITSIINLQSKVPTDEEIQKICQAYENKYLGDANLIFNRVWSNKR